MTTSLLLWGLTGSGKSSRAISLALTGTYLRILYITGMNADAEEKYSLLSKKPTYALGRFGDALHRFNASEVIGFFGPKTRKPWVLSSDKFFCVATYHKLFPVLLSNRCPTFDLIIFDEIDLAGSDPTYEQFVTLCLARNEEWGADIIACSAALNENSLENVAKWLGATKERCPGGTDVPIGTRFLNVPDEEYNSNGPLFVDKVVRDVRLSHRARTLVFVPSRRLVELLANRFAESRPRLRSEVTESIDQEFHDLRLAPIAFKQCVAHGVVYEHGYMKPRDRVLAREIFNSRQASYCFATNALERGVNVDALDVVVVRPDVGFWGTNQIINMVGRCDRIHNDRDQKGNETPVRGGVTFLTNGKVYTLDDLIPKDIVSKLDVNDFLVFRHTLDRLSVPTADLERKTLYYHTVSEHVLGSKTLSPNMDGIAFAMVRNFQKHAQVMAKSDVISRLSTAVNEQGIEDITRAYLDISRKRWQKLYNWERTKVKYTLRFFRDIATSWITKKLIMKSIFHVIHGERYGDPILDTFLEGMKNEEFDPILNESHHHYKRYKHEHKSRSNHSTSSGCKSIEDHGEEQEAQYLDHKTVRTEIVDALKKGKLTPFEALSKYRSRYPILLVKSAIDDYVKWKGMQRPQEGSTR